ncbi:MAG: DUF2800 domain-containing protein, partial [Ferruginibacter sp.]
MVVTKLIPDFSISPHIDQVGVEERATRFTKRSIKNETKLNGLKLALNMIDLTTLEGKDTDGKVKQLCYKAMHSHDIYSGLPTVAAVCVYPSMVKVAKKALEGSGIKVAAVATAFPSGQASREVKLRDTKFALNEGADEIDMVLSRGKFHMGEYNFVFDEIAAIKQHARYSEDMLFHVESYVKFVENQLQEARECTPDAVLLIEQLLDLRSWVPDGFGTADAVIIADGLMEIIDLKFGKGVPVSATSNKQM